MTLRLVTAALLASAAPAFAQAPQIVQDIAGTWQALPVGGGTGCSIGLTLKKAGPDSWVAKPAPPCATNVPAVVSVTAWRPMDGMQLLDAQGKVQLAFVEDETTLLSNPSVADPKLYLIPGIPGFTHVPQVGELLGRWTIRHKAASCGIQLTATVLGRSKTRAAKPGPGCTGATAKLDHWWFEGLTLLLGGANDLLLRFTPVGDARFKGEGQARNFATVGSWALFRPAPAAQNVRIQPEGK